MPSPRTLRIAILECDEPIGRTKEKYGGYGNLFKELLENGAAKLKEDEGQEVAVDVRKYDVVNQELFPDLEGDGLDGVLLTGSREYTTYTGGRVLMLRGWQGIMRSTTSRGF